MYVSDMFTVHTYLTTVERTLLRRGYNAIPSEITERDDADYVCPLHVKLHVDAGKRARVDDFGSIELDMAIPSVADRGHPTALVRPKMRTRTGVGSYSTDHTSLLRKKITHHAGPWNIIPATALGEAIADQLEEAGILPSNPVGLL